MKRRWIWLGAALAAAGCTTDAPTRRMEGRVHPAVVTAQNAFSLDFFHELLSNAPDRNIVASPLSASMALSMVYHGAAGETRAAMARALRLKDGEMDKVNETSAALLGSLETADPKVHLAVANSIWAREGEPFHQAFLDLNRDWYGAEIGPLDLARINGWVKARTSGRIEKLFDSLDRDAVMVLVNALYFKGEWRHKFDKGATRPADFMPPDGRRILAPRMALTETVPHLKGEGFEAVSLPFGGGRFSMVFVLADKDGVIETFGKWIGDLKPEHGTVEIPRFRIECELDLKPPLSAMGMGVAFTPNADFSGISPEPLMISRVKQKTFLEVNEEGAEAAAATGVEMVRTAAPMPSFHFVADRPFFCAIRDGETNSLLFLARIVRPEGG